MVTSLERQLWSFNWILQDALQHSDSKNSSRVLDRMYFLENSIGPYTFPGEIAPGNQDCLYILLDLSINHDNEAFVLGFAMGNDEKARHYHLLLFKFASEFIYSPKHRFNQRQLKFFERGFLYGKSLPTKNLHCTEFERFYSNRIGEIRAYLDIWLEEVEDYRQGLIPQFME
ncbi:MULTISPECIES: hypothetical protein [unclassified Leptolyngbya]|uniref:hypothetical protein n=1 Tax=unclassified Leptolyngbya TaxID=2650499 RepID=UPI001687D072|nr:MULTISPECIES: hypothetical protein [unclassified Leptolyngbya]MBD1909996.1 hypothetical protein [Leptolyngbya sp. FACHB-8]MBD2157133.1 hypothetical protein [Leptolyngbya sp. FACHB-16]